MSTREQREAAFSESKAILALENMTAPADYAKLRQDVIDGKLSIPDAVAQLVAQARKRSRSSSSP
jgi:hypothetical protein